MYSEGRMDPGDSSCPPQRDSINQKHDLQYAGPDRHIGHGRLKTQYRENESWLHAPRPALSLGASI